MQPSQVGEAFPQLWALYDCSYYNSELILLKERPLKCGVLWAVFSQVGSPKTKCKGHPGCKAEGLNTEIPTPGSLFEMHNGWTQYSRICDVRQNKNSSGQSSLLFSFSLMGLQQHLHQHQSLNAKCAQGACSSSLWGWGTALRSHCEANYVVDTDVKALKFTHLPSHCPEAKLLQSELTPHSQNHGILWEIELCMVGVFSLIMPMKTAKRFLMVTLGSWLVFKQKSEESQPQKFSWLVLSQLRIFLSCLL